VVSNFIIQALKNEPITVYGDGTQTRSFCYVDDLISGFLLLMESQSDYTSPVNLGNPSEFSVMELAEKIISIIGSKSKISLMSLPVDDPRQRKPDISLAKNNLHWSPEINVDDGLKKTISYFERKLLED